MEQIEYGRNFRKQSSFHRGVTAAFDKKDGRKPEKAVMTLDDLAAGRTNNFSSILTLR
jgi:hypothetical protein